MEYKEYCCIMKYNEKNALGRFFEANNLVIEKIHRQEALTPFSTNNTNVIALNHPDGYKVHFTARKKTEDEEFTDKIYYLIDRLK